MPLQCSFWCSEPFFFPQVLNSCYSATLVCSSGTVAIVATTFFFFSLVFRLYFFFFLLNIYKNLHIYCYTDTTNFTIFSQYFHNIFTIIFTIFSQYLINQNKIIKYKIVTNHNCK